SSFCCLRWRRAFCSHADLASFTRLLCATRSPKTTQFWQTKCSLSADVRENGPEILAEEVTAHRAGQHTPYWIRILDSQGRAIAETPQMDRLIPTQIFPAGREPAEALRTRKDYRSSGKFFSLVAFNEHPAGKAYTLQLAQDRASDEQVERHFALLFIAVLFGGVVASALIAIVVTRRGLRPLREMTESL